MSSLADLGRPMGLEPSGNVRHRFGIVFDADGCQRRVERIVRGLGCRQEWAPSADQRGSRIQPRSYGMFRGRTGAWIHGLPGRRSGRRRAM